MEVNLASVLGYCMGVRRAVETAEKALLNNPGKKVYSLGPLIHNSSVLKNLSDKGLSILEENQIDDVEEGAFVIIRAHGVSPKVYDFLEKKNCTVIDATCPRVVGSQRNVRKYSREGYDVFLAGDKNHGEVLGIQGFAEGPFFLLQDESEVGKVCGQKAGSEESRTEGRNERRNEGRNEGRKAVLLSQTTFSPSKFEAIADSLKEKYPDSLKVMNTICPATKERQDALIQLCEKVDAVIVVGGKASANTKRLLQTAQKYCPHCVLIETALEIPEEFFSFEKVGVTAGASTPDEDIKAVCETLASERTLSSH